MYTYRMIIRLQDTDAAGVLFFANYFRLTHEAYETFMAGIGFDFYHMIHEWDYLVLIAHAECDFKRPLHVGDAVTIHITCSKLGRTSFTLDYTLVDDDDNTVATGNSIHACVNKSDLNSIPLPEVLKAELEKLRE